MTITISEQQAIEALRRAQFLKDQGLIDQAEGVYYDKKDSKHCFCALGAIYSEAGALIPNSEQKWNDYDIRVGSKGILYKHNVMGMNDDSHMSFGEIADALEKLN